MGGCVTKCHDEGHTDKEDDISGNSADHVFDEDRRNKTRKEADGGGDRTAGRRQRRRKSSGLSQYSQDGRHVIHKPCCIGAFNVKRFGAAKVKDREILEMLVRLVREFDVLVVQEVVDVSGEAINTLLEEVNKVQDHAGPYEVLTSPRVGRSAQKEQYVLFYRTNVVNIKESEIYHDPGDKFIREPFLVKMEVETVVEMASNIILVAVHTQPKSANSEIDRLADVHKYVVDKWELDNVVILGDLNASGPYVRVSDWQSNRLRGGDFTWLIPDHVDTTATNTLAAYDRIVVSGAINKAVVANSAKVFRYDELYQVSVDTVNKVSDHYPVCFSLDTLPHPTVRKNIRTKMIFKVEDNRFIDSSPEIFIQGFNLKRFKLKELYGKSGELERIEITSQKLSKVSGALSCMETLRRHDRSLISYSALASIRHQVASAAHTLLEDERSKFRLVVNLHLPDNNIHTQLEINT